MSSLNVAKKPMVVGGKLKLKGSGSGARSGLAVAVPRRPADSQVTVIGKKRSAAEIEASSEAPFSPSISSSTVQMTEAQRRFKEKQRQLEERQLRKVAAKPYRERVEEFNEKLSKLTEHNDIPRISAAGNG